MNDYKNKPLRFVIDNPNDWIQREHVLGRYYEEEELRLISKYIHKDDIVVDIGANVGNHSIYFSKNTEAKEIYAIEPIPKSAQILLANLSLNYCHNVNIDYIGVGLGRVNMIAYPFMTHGPDNLGAIALYSEKFEGGTFLDPVQIVSGDSIFENIDVNFMKIDVEFMEMEVLAGLERTIRRSKPTIFIEVQEDNDRVFNEWVISNGYNVIQTLEGGHLKNYLIENSIFKKSLAVNDKNYTKILKNIPNVNKYVLHYLFEDMKLQHKKDTLWMEFGVFSGRTINYISKFTDKTVYGFDSFYGLPEDWRNGFAKGTFNMNGHLPKVNDNVTLISGWFEDTLETFMKFHNQKISFIHIDSDIYSSAKYVLNTLKNSIDEGCIIVFDELVNYPGYGGETGELKALYEFIEENNVKYEWIGMNGIVEMFNPKYENEQVAIKILEIN